MQYHKIIKLCGAVWQIDDAKVSNLMLTHRVMYSNNLEHLCFTR